jgi:hypothetical protein
MSISTGMNTSAVSVLRKVNSTVATGRMARGKNTLLTMPALSMIAPVAIIAELTKNVHARRPSSR